MNHRSTAVIRQSTSRTFMRSTMAIAIGHLIAGGMIAAPLVVTPSSAIAQQVAQARAYAIPAGLLENVLTQFGREAGIMLSFNGEATTGLQSDGLKGNYTVEGGLHTLLSSSGFAAVRQDNGSYLLSKVVSGDTALPAVTVTAAQETTEGTGSYAQRGASSTATKLALTAKETPQSVSIVTRQRLDDQRLENITEVMEATIGISTFRQGVVGIGMEQPYSRGFSVSNYLIDGMPRSNTLSAQMNTAAFDRVEVLRGATGLTSGMGYPGASINMVRKRPTREAQGSISVEAGSWNRYGIGLDLSKPLTESGHVRSRLVVDYKDQESWLDRYATKGALVYGITEVDLSRDTLLTVGFNYLKNNHDSPLRSGVPQYYSDKTKINLPRSFNTAPTWTYYDTEEISTFISLRHNLASNWKANVEFSYTKDKYDAIVPWMSGSINSTTGLGATMAPANWYGDGQQFNLDASLSGSFSLFGRAHELVTGFYAVQRKDDSVFNGFLYSWNSSYNGAINAPIWAWNGTQANYPQFNKTSDGKATKTEYTAYASSRFSLTDRANLILGARVMNWESVTENIPLTGPATTTTKKEKGVVVPYAGFTYDLNKTWTAYGSYTQIFQPQSASTLDINRNPLDPEEGTAYEIGLKASLLDQKLNASFALFQVEQEKVASYNSLTMAYESLEGIHTQGAEVELSGELADGWSATAGYAYSVSKDKEGKRVMERIPRHTVKTFTTYRLPGELNRWTVGGGATWQSTYGWEGAQANGWDQQKSFVLANLMMRYKLSPSTELSANLNNVFDKKYYTALADIGFYGAPRNLMVSLKHRF